MQKILKTIKEMLKASSYKAKILNAECEYINLSTAIGIIDNVAKDAISWIPCIKRLPNKEYELEIQNRGRDAAYPVIVTAKTVDGRFYVTNAWYVELFLERNFYTDDMQPLDVIAWMPQPKPFEGD